MTKTILVPLAPQTSPADILSWRHFSAGEKTFFDTEIPTMSS